MATPRSRSHADLLKEARDRFKLANESDTKQAIRERDDIAFEDGDQWPAAIKAARQAQPVAGLPAAPALPTLTINKLKEPVRQILNQERGSDLGVTLVPADDFGDLGVVPDSDEIDTREGLIRRIQRDSIASDARTWGFKRAVIAGRGYYLINTRYLPGKTRDQEIYISRIFNQASVLLDPAHEQPDGSDAEWGFIGRWRAWDTYRAENKKVLREDGKLQQNPLTNSNDSDFMGLTEQYPDWYKAEGENRAVREVSYWYAEYDTRDLYEAADGLLVWADERADGGDYTFVRSVADRRVKYCRIGGGTQILQQTDWLGPDIPIVKIVGDEVLPYDTERRVEGIVRPARDSAQGFNYMVSRFVTSVGLSQIPRDRIDPAAIDGYEDWWLQANTRPLPYLPIRTYDDEGRPFNPPTTGTPDPTILAVAQGIALFDQTIKSTTAVPDSTLGNVDPTLKSGRAIREVVANAAQSTSNFLDNLARSMRYEAQIINNLLYPIYGQKPGRLVRIMTGEGESQSRVIGDLPPQGQLGAMGQPGQPPQASPTQQAAKRAKLTKDAHFNIAVKISKSFDTRRSELVTKLGELIAVAPDQMGIAGDILYKNMDIPEAKQLADRMRVMLAPPVQQMLEAEKTGQPFDPTAQAKIAELEKQLDVLQNVATDLQQKAEGKQIESQTRLEIERLKAEQQVLIEQVRARTDLEKARMDNATRIHVAEIAAKTKGVIQAQEMEHEAIALAHTQEHESEQAALDRENLERQADRQDAEAERSRQFEAEETERGRQAELQSKGTDK